MPTSPRGPDDLPECRDVDETIARAATDRVLLDMIDPDGLIRPPDMWDEIQNDALGG